SLVQRIVSVRQVTQRNAGRHTAGIDGVVTLDSAARMAMAREVLRAMSSWEPLPVRWGCISPRRTASSGRSAYRRVPQTARSRRPGEVPESFVTVTHPFHPLSGQRLRVLFERKLAGGLAVSCEGGPLGSLMLPVTWT